MDQARIVYRHNTESKRGLATAGIFFIKAILAIPHMIIMSALTELAFAAAYIGYWVVAFTGKLPGSFQDFAAWSLRWQTRTFGWYFGNEDRYPPFELDAEYSLDLKTPRNGSPSSGWAIAGIFFIKWIVAIPHFVAIVVLFFVTMVMTWIGFIIAAFTGKLPVGIQNLAAGVLQWEARVACWIFGLTDTYPPFGLHVEPTA
jgi:hypothetical protein